MTAPVRRQARGRARMASILDATEQLVAEVGYDEMSTNAVASRAGISPGSLYQFFGGKADLLAGLVDRYTQDFQRFWDEQLTDDVADLPLEVVVDRLIDAVVAFKGERPAFWALLHGSATSDTLAAASARLDEQLTGRLADLYARRAPHLDATRRRLVAQVSVATVKALMGMVMDPARREGAGEATAELKRVLVGYLGPALAPPSSRTTPPSH